MIAEKQKNKKKRKGMKRGERRKAGLFDEDGNVTPRRPRKKRRRNIPPMYCGWGEKERTRSLDSEDPPGGRVASGFDRERTGKIPFSKEGGEEEIEKRTCQEALKVQFIWKKNWERLEGGGEGGHLKYEKGVGERQKRAKQKHGVRPKVQHKWLKRKKG